MEDSPCGTWVFAYEYFFYLTIITGAMVGLINTICVEIFKTIVVFEGCKTVMEESIAQINRIVMV